MSLKADVLRGLKWTAGAKFSGQLVTWGITIFIMRLLAPADYGLLAMASVLIVFMNMVAEVGLGPALVQAHEVDTRQLRQAFGIFLLVNWALCLLLNLLAPAMAVFYDEPRLELVLRVLSVQFLFTPLAVVPEVLLQRQLEYKKRSLIDLSTAIFTSVATLLLALGHYGVWALVLGNVGATVWRTVLVNSIAPFPHWPSFAVGGMRKLLSFGGKVTVSRFLWMFFTQIDVVIVGRVLGSEVLGMYSVAMHLASMPVQRVSSILNQVAFPAFARHQHDRSLIAVQLLKVLRMLGFVAFPVLWGIASVAPELVAVLLGPGWSGAVMPLQVLALVMPLRAIVGFLPSVTDAVGRPEVAMHNVLVGCAVMPLAFWLGTQWGMVGVAYAWLLAYPVVLLVNTRRMVAVVGLTLAQVSRHVAPSMLCGAAMFGAVWAVQLALRAYPDRRVVLAVEVLVGAASYLLGALALNRATLQEIGGAVFGKAGVPQQAHAE